MRARRALRLQELRAVGDVLMEQLFFMVRTGFDAFDLQHRRL